MSGCCHLCGLRWDQHGTACEVRVLSRYSPPDGCPGCNRLLDLLRDARDELADAGHKGDLMYRLDVALGDR